MNSEKKRWNLQVLLINVASVSASLKRGLREGGVCRHDFMKVYVEGVHVTHAKGQGVSFYIQCKKAQKEAKR